jgi:phage terminase large subunit
VTGKSVFNSKALTERLLLNIQPKVRGIFNVTLNQAEQVSEYKFINDKNGFISVYKSPEHNVPYVIGADTAGDGSDSFVAQVLDNRTGEQVAVLRHQTDEDLFAKQLYCLGLYYNTALIAVETNYSTFPVRELERLKYPKQYLREQVDTFTGKIKHSWGFVTNSKTRPIIIAELVKAVRDDITIVNDKTTIEEMLTFVRDEHFRPEAE